MHSFFLFFFFCNQPSSIHISHSTFALLRSAKTHIKTQACTGETPLPVMTKAARTAEKARYHKCKLLRFLPPPTPPSSGFSENSPDQAVWSTAVKVTHCKSCHHVNHLQYHTLTRFELPALQYAFPVWPGTFHDAILPARTVKSQAE